MAVSSILGEETAATRIIQIIAALEVTVEAAATMITLGTAVVARTEDLVELTEEVVDLGQVIHHQLVVITV